MNQSASHEHIVMSYSASNQPSGDMESFSAYLRSSNRILSLLGAGLSAASGLPTFRGAGGIWRNQQAVQLATPSAFRSDPGLVWQFYGYRRHMALQAKPNPAHFALAELSRQKPDFLTLSQNVDGKAHLMLSCQLLPPDNACQDCVLEPDIRLSSCTISMAPCST